MQLLAVLILAPWLSTSGTYKSTFNNPGTLVVNPTWFTFFQIFSAFSNDGLRCLLRLFAHGLLLTAHRSLDDANMTDFGRAYLLQIVLGFLILGGNTAYPIFLRIIMCVQALLARSGSTDSEPSSAGACRKWSGRLRGRTKHFGSCSVSIHMS